MAQTPEQLKDDHDAFSAAFNEPEQEKTPMSEDEAFGLNEPEDGHEEGQGEQGSAPAVSIDADHASADSGQSAASEASETPAQEAAESPADQAQEQAQGTEDAPTDPADVQRQKSWEGRLKAREAELKAREDALKAKEAPAAADEGTPAEEAGESPTEEGAEELVQAAQDGTLTAEQAKKILSEDFGDDFVKMISALVEAKAGEAAEKVATEKAGGVDKTVQQLISELTDEKAKNHFETIADAHPDFMEFADGPIMEQYLQSLPEDKQAEAQQIIQSGSARQVIKLLNNVKSALEVKEPEQDDSQDNAMAAAEGVRSKGAMRVPEKPKLADDYESAWNSF